MDLCRECIKYKQFELEKCSQCGCKTIEMNLEGPTIIGKCSYCGNSFVGASFFSACELDDIDYSLTICNQILSNEQIIKISTLLGVRVLEVKRIIAEEDIMSKFFSLKQIVPIIHYLKKEKIMYKLNPDLPYSRLFDCEKGKLKIKGVESCQS